MTSPITVIYTCPMCGSTKDISTKPLSHAISSEHCESCNYSAEVYSNMSIIVPRKNIGTNPTVR